MVDFLSEDGRIRDVVQRILNFEDEADLDNFLKKNPCLFCWE